MAAVDIAAVGVVSTAAEAEVSTVGAVEEDPVEAQVPRLQQVTEAHGHRPLLKCAQGIILCPGLGTVIPNRMAISPAGINALGILPRRVPPSPTEIGIPLAAQMGAASLQVRHRKQRHRITAVGM